jgi:hypothetical protein
MDGKDLEALKRFDEEIGIIERGVKPLYKNLENPVNTSEWRERLKGLEAPRDTAFADIPERKKQSIEDRLCAISLIGSTDQEGFTRACKEYYGNCIPSESDVKKAGDVLKAVAVSDVGEKRFGRYEIADLIGSHLNPYPDIRDAWNVVFVKGQGVSSPSYKRVIEIGEECKRTHIGAERTARHEISHVLLCSNGLLQEPLSNTFFYGTCGGKIRLDEGLAILAGEGFGQSEIVLSKRTPAYVIAVHARLNGAGRGDVINMLAEYDIGMEDAEYVAERVSRGLKDPEKSGCFPKDAVYMLGRWDIGGYVSRGGDPRTLYTGCISMGELPLITTLLNEGILKPARYLPEALKEGPGL